MGRWSIREGALDLQFYADGKFTRYMASDYHEWWGVEGTYQLAGQDRVVVELPDEGKIEYEYRIQEPWLLLRDQSGTITTYRRSEE